MTRTVAASVFLCVALTLSADAQRPTPAQQAEAALGAAIHQDEVENNLQAAIAEYKNVVSRFGSNRRVAAEAQYRLSQALLQKGDLAGASDALVQLSAGYPDQAGRVSELAGGSAGGTVTLALVARAGGGGRGAMAGGQSAFGAGYRAGGPQNLSQASLIDPATATPEQRREAIRKRLESLSPEEREAFKKRRAERQGGATE